MYRFILIQKIVEKYGNHQMSILVLKFVKE